jgi:hypothetical protein
MQETSILLFGPKAGASAFFSNISKLLPDYTTLLSEDTTLDIKKNHT